VRVNLEHVAAALRPPQEPLDPDYDPWKGVVWTEEQKQEWKEMQARKRRSREE
jgi:hypothetical protein